MDSYINRSEYIGKLLTYKDKDLNKVVSGFGRQITAENTVEREFGALEKINDNYPKYLLTTDSFTQNRRGVKHLNVFNWLLGTSEKEE